MPEPREARALDAERMPEPRPIATFDLTRRCPSRCRHCYFFKSPPAGRDIDETTFVRRARALRSRYGIRSAFWVGGEPLLRLRLLRLAMGLFPRNAVATSGMVPIPADLDAGLLVSIDGPLESHDRLRGTGAFERVMRHLAPVPAASFALSVTLTSATVEAIAHLPALVESSRAAGAVVGFHVGLPGDSLRIDGPARDRAVDRLLELSATHPGSVLNPPASLELFRPGRSSGLAAQCIYRDRAIAFDTRLRRKRPCTFGRQASCDACGCPVVAAQGARDLGDRHSDAFLRSLFPRAALCSSPSAASPMPQAGRPADSDLNTHAEMPYRS